MELKTYRKRAPWALIQAVIVGVLSIPFALSSVPTIKTEFEIQSIARATDKQRSATELESSKESSILFVPNYHCASGERLAQSYMDIHILSKPSNIPAAGAQPYRLGDAQQNHIGDIHRTGPGVGEITMHYADCPELR